MRRLAACSVVLVGAVGGTGAVLFACSGNPNTGAFAAYDSGGATITLPDGNVVHVSEDGGTAPIFGQGSDDSGSPGVTYTDGGCQGLQCAISATCTNDGGTTISGTIYDPAGANPLYNVLAYVPMYDPANPSAIPSGAAIEPITGGVTFPSGVSCDSCSYLYSGNPIAVGVSGTDGTFTITNAPSGTNIPVVVQVGKWRTHTTVSTVTSCQDNSAGKINLPSAGSTTDPIISLPQIAVSTGSSDSLECLLLRVGVSANEYTSGAGGTGHVHLYTGGSNSGGGLSGSPEQGATAPASPTNLWDTVAHLEQYDITLLSCEGGETYNAVPANLETYLNNGGRVFASHYHYAWFTKPSESGQSYTPPTAWSNLATWTTGSNSTDDSNVGGEIVTTLNTSGGGTFSKGQILHDWLKDVSALGTAFPGGGTPANGTDDLAIGTVRFNAKVTSSNTETQPWVTTDMSTVDSDSTSFATAAPTIYLSFDTPVGATAPPDGGSPPYCGRAVFSGLHVQGGAGNNDSTDEGTPAPTGCSPGSGQLSPQEKALEFMLFDLSSCVTPDKAAPGVPIPVPPPPPPPK